MKNSVESSTAVCFLTSPKPFVALSTQLQTAALRSWREIVREAEILAFGVRSEDESLVMELDGAIACEVDVSQGCPPLLPNILKSASSQVKSGIFVYLNCDILLLPAFTAALNACARRLSRFVMVGQRLDLGEGILFNGPRDHWAWDSVAGVRRGNAVLHSPSGSDYFAFPKGVLDGIPDIVVGRGAYDNAIIAYCLRNGIPIVDASRFTLVYHQHHDYDHVPGGQSQVFHGEEAQSNRRLIASSAVPTLEDATHKLMPDGKVLKNHARGDWVRELELYWRFRVGSEALGEFTRKLGRALDHIGWSQPVKLSIEDVSVRPVGGLM